MPHEVVAFCGRYVKDELASDPDNWVWSSQGTVNMHLPEK